MIQGENYSSESESESENVPHPGNEEIAVAEEDWLGSSDDEVEQRLKGEEAQIQRDEDEFFNELKHTEHPEGFVDLNGPSVDYDEVKTRAEMIVSTLQNFNELAEPGLTRKDYKARLIEDLSALYGYNHWLLEQILSLLPIGEVIPFIEANEHQRPVVIRTNTLRTRRNELKRVLNERGVNLDDIRPKWTNVGLVIFDSQVPIGATPEYLSGHYMLQSPSSFLPVMALNPTASDRVLDMCAAPGGKTTHMAQLMGNQGIIIANDYFRARTDALVANIHRLGVTNTIVVNYDGRAFPEIMGGFTKVLCDAPCSGTGVISRDPSVKTSKSEADLKVLVKNQKELILHAYDSITTAGGRLCYCTCSLLVEENEGVVDYLLKHRRCKCIPCGLPPEFDAELTKGVRSYKQYRYDPSVENSRKVFPHKLNMDGFFLALIDVPPGPRGEIPDEEEQKPKPKKEKMMKESKKKAKKHDDQKVMEENEENQENDHEQIIEEEEQSEKEVHENKKNKFAKFSKKKPKSKKEKKQKKFSKRFGGR